MVPGEEEGDWLGQRDKGKKMEVTGVFGESTGFFFCLFVSPAQHPRPDTTLPRIGEVDGWVIFSKIQVSSCGHPSNHLVNMCLGTVRTLVVCEVWVKGKQQASKCDQLRAQPRCG